MHIYFLWSFNKKFNDTYINLLSILGNLPWSLNYPLFCKQHFSKQCQTETGKKLRKTKQHLEAEHSLFKNYLLSSSTISSKDNRRYSKKCGKEKCVCRDDVIWLITKKRKWKWKMKWKMKNRSQIYDIHRTRPMDTNILNIKCILV